MSGNSPLMDYYFLCAWPTERSRKGEKGLKISFAQICLRHFPYFMPAANEKFCKGSARPARAPDSGDKRKIGKVGIQQGMASFWSVVEKREKLNLKQS